jgi:hypothetical protein
MACGFSDHKNMTSKTMHTNILRYNKWEKTSIGVGQPPTSHEHEGIGEGEEGMYMIIESGLQLKTMRNGYVKKSN